MGKWLVYQCWIAPGCKTLSEAINNPRLIRLVEFQEEGEAERYLQQCKAKSEKDFVYWKESSPLHGGEE